MSLFSPFPPSLPRVASDALINPIVPGAFREIILSRRFNSLRSAAERERESKSVLPENEIVSYVSSSRHIFYDIYRCKISLVYILLFTLL